MTAEVHPGSDERLRDTESTLLAFSYKRGFGVLILKCQNYQKLSEKSLLLQRLAGNRFVEV